MYGDFFEANEVGLVSGIANRQIVHFTGKAPINLFFQTWDGRYSRMLVHSTLLRAS